MGKKKKREQAISRILYWLMTILHTALVIMGTVVLCISFLGYGIQWHNVDLSYNMLLISNDLDDLGWEYDTDYREWEDKYGLGDNETMYYSDGYVAGATNLKNLLIIGTIGGCCFTWGLAGLFFTTMGLLEKMYDGGRKG
jgi:hypothetical protein